MKRTNLFNRLLCMVLVVAMVAGYAVPAHATHTHDHAVDEVPVQFTLVDNDEVKADLGPNGETEVADAPLAGS